MKKLNALQKGYLIALLGMHQQERKGDVFVANMVDSIMDILDLLNPYNPETTDLDAFGTPKGAEKDELY